MLLQDKNVLVVGAGISGMAAVKLLQQVGSCPVLYDENTTVTPEQIRQKAENIGIDSRSLPIYTGSLPEEVQNSVEILVLSPGVPVDTEFTASFRSKDIPVWGEIELGYRLAKGRLAAITGTNGKTTTTTLVGEIMKAYYDSVFVVGNIGNPYTLEAMETTEDTVTVAEISSFQLETTETFHPAVSAVLNITPDHLNRHHTMENYVAAKEAIAVRQTAEEVCVLNYENEYTRSFGDRCPARVVYFSSARELEDGYYLKDEMIYRAEAGKSRPVLHIHKDMNLVGMCNVENVMAAIAISEHMGVPEHVIVQVIRQFQAVEHRIEFVAGRGGVDYYNDSKGTNPDAAIQGIRAMTKPTVLIGGGYDKQSEYDEWIESFNGKVKCLVLIGQTKEKIAECAGRHGISNIILADTFEEAFQICVSQAEPGDAVLLSPACASWGMFPNYEVRGKMFKDYVYKLKE